MKYFVFSILVLFSASLHAQGFHAKCDDFRGAGFDAKSEVLTPFEMNDGTIYEFNYFSKNGGSLKYVVDGIGIVDPKKEMRWTELQLLQQRDNNITAINYIGDNYMLFTLYPGKGMLHIAWIEHPNRKNTFGNSFLIKVSCTFDSV